MTLSIRNPKAEKLARDLAAYERTSITKLVLSALEDRERARARKETPGEIAERILARRGIFIAPGGKPVPQSAYHDLDHDLTGEDD